LPLPNSQLPPQQPPLFWSSLLAELRNHVPADGVEVWLDPLAVERWDASSRTLTLRAPSEHHASYVSDFLADTMCKVANDLHGAPLHLAFVHDEPTTVRFGQPAPTPAPAPVPTGVDPTRTFDNYVEGSCNKFARASAINAAGGADRTNNPLLIYGPTGCGKTHLLSAIGNEVARRDDGARVLYVTSESFVNDMIRALQNRMMEEFRAKYRRSCDYLLIDDVQFLAGKERTQEEFFHTFNELISGGALIAMTSDVPPSEITGLEGRLRTRFGAGLIADIGPTDPETMRAIIQQKAADRNIEFPPEVSKLIADRHRGSVRDAEGAVNKLCALHTFFKKPITEAFLRENMPELFSAPRRTITIELIIEATARYHALKPEDLTGTSKTKTLTSPRHIAMYLARELTEASFPEIGKAFGGRDHSTVQYACKKITESLKTNSDLRVKIEIIREALLK
jgi:chromosomal replication initiator protein